MTRSELYFEREEIEEIQFILFRWLQEIGYADYSQIKSTLKDIIVVKEFNHVKGNLYDKIFRPLYQIGMVESIIRNNKIYYCLVDSRFYENGNEYSFSANRIIGYFQQPTANADTSSNALELLKKIPAIDDVIAGWDYKKNINDSLFYKNNKEYSVAEITTGIYNLSNNTWNTSSVLCVGDKKFVKKIPNINMSTEGMRIARCKIANEKGIPLFWYDKERNKIFIRGRFDIPIPIFRIFYRFNPDKLPGNTVQNMPEDYVFNINEYIFEDILKELKRIFSDSCVVESCIEANNAGHTTDNLNKVQTFDANGNIIPKTANCYCEKRFDKWGLYEFENNSKQIGHLLVDFKYQTIANLMQHEKQVYNTKGELINLYDEKNYRKQFDNELTGLCLNIFQ